MWYVSGVKKCAETNNFTNVFLDRVGRERCQIMRYSSRECHSELRSVYYMRPIFSTLFVTIGVDFFFSLVPLLVSEVIPMSNNKPC